MDDDDTESALFSLKKKQFFGGYLNLFKWDLCYEIFRLFKINFFLNMIKVALFYLNLYIVCTKIKHTKRILVLFLLNGNT